MPACPTLWILIPEKLVTVRLDVAIGVVCSSNLVWFGFSDCVHDGDYAEDYGEEVDKEYDADDCDETGRRRLIITGDVVLKQ